MHCHTHTDAHTHTGTHTVTRCHVHTVQAIMYLHFNASKRLYNQHSSHCDGQCTHRHMTPDHNVA